MLEENTMLCLLVLTGVLYGCQSPPVRVAACPPMDVPPMVIQKREPNLTQRLWNVFSLSEEKGTPRSGI